MTFGTGHGTSGPAFDLVLVAHVVAAVVGFGSMALTGAQAWRARRPPAPSARTSLDVLRRFFPPGPDVVGRTVYAVPALGVALIALSHGAYHAGDTFVGLGGALWVLGVGVGELVLWPGERRIGLHLARAAEREDPGEHWPTAECRRVALASLLTTLVFVGATAVMFSKP